METTVFPFAHHIFLRLWERRSYPSGDSLPRYGCSVPERDYSRRLFLQRKALIFLDNDLDFVLAAEVGIGTDRISGFHDTVLNVGIITQVNIIENDGILDHAIVSYIDVFEQYRILHAAVNNTAAGNQTVMYIT